MRRFLTILAAVGAAVVGATILVILNLNRILDANRERILAELSKGFARPVQVERLAVGFHGGIAAELDGLRVADDPAFSTEDFLTAERTYAVVRVGPLLRGRIAVRRIAVSSPHVTIIRTARGVNVDSLGRRPDGGGGEGRANGASAPAGDAATFAVAVALLNLEHGAVRYVDRTGAKPVETTVSPLDVRLSDLSLTTPMHLEVDATLSGAPPTTLRVHGTVGPVGDPPFAADVPVEQHVVVRGGALDVRDLAITGRVRRDRDGAPVASVRIVAPAVRGGGVDVANLDVALAEEGGVATLERLALSVFGGTITGRGKVDHAGKEPGFSFETTVRGMDVSQALAARAPDLAARFHGRLDADWSLGGRLGEEAVVRRSLAGKGHAVVHDGTLAGVNVAESVLTGATGVGGLVTLVPPRVRDRYPDLFGAADTRFDELASDVRIGGERLQIDALTVSARDYTVRGKGVVTFAQQADLTATLIASERLTADIVGALAEARYLADDTGRIGIPFRFAGVLPNVRPKPDEELVGRVLRKALVGDGLERLLGGGKHDDPKDGKHPADDSKGLLKRGLDKLFGR